MCPLQVHNPDMMFKDWTKPPLPRFKPLKILGPGDMVQMRMLNSTPDGFTNKGLEKMLRGELKRVGAGELGEYMVKQFMGGKARLQIHGRNTALVKQARSTDAFRVGRNAIAATLGKKIKTQRKYGGGVYNLKFGSCPWIGWNAIWHTMLPGSSTKPLGACIGGTKANRVYVRNLVETPEKVCLDLRIEGWDHFGVDTTDTYTPGLVAFWLLQHNRTGPQRPFANLLVLEERLTFMCGGRVPRTASGPARGSSVMRGRPRR